MSNHQQVFDATLAMLTLADKWARTGNLTVAPKSLAKAIIDADTIAWESVPVVRGAANANDTPSLQLAIALGQVLEDFRAFQALDGFERAYPGQQINGQPIPRFWHSLTIVAQRYIAVTTSDVIVDFDAEKTAVESNLMGTKRKRFVANKSVQRMLDVFSATERRAVANAEPSPAELLPRPTREQTRAAVVQTYVESGHTKTPSMIARELGAKGHDITPPGVSSLLSYWRRHNGISPTKGRPRK